MVEQEKYFMSPVPLYICEQGETKKVPNAEVDLISLNLIDATTGEVISSQHPEWEGCKVAVAFDYGEVNGYKSFNPKGSFPLLKPWKIPSPQALLTTKEIETATQYQVDFLESASPSLRGSTFIKKQQDVGYFFLCYMKCGFRPLEGMLVDYVWNILGWFYDDVLELPPGSTPPTIPEYFEFLEPINRMLQGKEDIGDMLKMETFAPHAAALPPICRKFRELCLTYASDPEEIRYVMRELMDYLEVVAYEKHGWNGTDGMSSYMAMRQYSIATGVWEEISLIQSHLDFPEWLRGDPLRRYLSRLIADLFTMLHDAQSLKKELENGEESNYIIVRMKQDGKSVEEAWNEAINMEIPRIMKEIEEASKKLGERWGGLKGFDNFLEAKYDITDACARFGLLSKRYGNVKAGTSVTFTKQG